MVKKGVGKSRVMINEHEKTCDLGNEWRIAGVWFREREDESKCGLVVSPEAREGLVKCVIAWRSRRKAMRVRGYKKKKKKVKINEIKLSPPRLTFSSNAYGCTYPSCQNSSQKTNCKAEANNRLHEVCHMKEKNNMQ